MRIATWTLPAALVLPLMAAAPVSGGEVSVGTTTSSTLGTDWVVSSGDNVCGVSDARQISNPARVSYDSLLGDTAELKEMKKKGIDKDSPEGQILHNKGVDRVRKAAKTVMTDKSHCSVWKKITSRKGNSVPDITEAVRAQL